MKLFIVFISILFDLLFLNIIKYTSFSIPFFYPMLTITSVVFISNFYKHQDRKNYYYLVLLISIIYDAFFINNLLITVFLFELISIINIKIREYYSKNIISNIFGLIASLIIYDFMFHILLVITKYQNFDLSRLLFKFSHSIIINVLYIILMFMVLKPKKA